ncbi:MAG TPA: hypothetical protein PKK84_08150, partial [Armatimonadota bacterium]|nr:hypothetical protein [Armatimonadota bacterium]
KEDAPVAIGGGLKLPYPIMKSDAQHWAEGDIKLVTSLIEAKKVTGNVVSTNTQTHSPAAYQGLKITLDGHQFLEEQEEEERKSRVRYKVTEVLKVVFWLAVGAVITILVEWAASRCGMTTPK